MKKIVLPTIVCLFLAACSSDEETNKANPCATPGATYHQTFETLSGDCPDIPSGDFTISSDGTLDQSISCEEIEQDGCVAHDTNCHISSNGCDITETFTTNFEADGSYAYGSMSVSAHCNDGSSCSGRYSFEMFRQ